MVKKGAREKKGSTEQKKRERERENPNAKKKKLSSVFIKKSLRYHGGKV